MEVRLLGPVDVTVGGVPRPLRGLRRKAVLAVLALHRGQVVGTERLVDLVWGDTAPQTAVNTLQSTISHLRRVLGSRESIVAAPPGYALAFGDDDGSDVAHAERLIAQGTDQTDPDQRVRRLTAALALWRDRALVDVAQVPWLRAQADTLERLRLRARLALTDARLARGEHALVVPELEILIRDHPLDERLHGQLMLALYRAGRQADALATYRRLSMMLRDEHGIGPSAPLRHLEAAVLRQDPSLDAAPPITPRAASVGRPPLGGPAVPGQQDDLATTERLGRGGTAVPGQDELATVGQLRRGSAAATARYDHPVTVGRLRLGGAAVVGRQDELATLHGLAEAASQGTGGAVFVVGEPGMGKSRLATEAGLLATAAGLRVLRGRAAAPAVQFRPLSEALFSALRRTGVPDTPDLLPYRPALSRLLPELRSVRLPGPDDSLVVLAEAVLRLCVRIGDSRGALLILEDLHDADADTLAVLDYLVDNARPEPLLLLGTLRPDPGPALELVLAARRRRSATVLELPRLTDGAIRELAAGCLDVPPEDVPGPVLTRLLDTADGVPLHVEELLAGMVSDRALVRSGPRWFVPGAVSAAVPATLAATLTGRADRLSTRSRTLLTVSALLGRRFPATVAGLAAGLTEAALADCLREAVEARLLTPDGGPGEYAFRHALTAEALRDRLLPAERATLSRRAAEALETTDPALIDGGERLTGELWESAGEPDRAARMFATAAGRAAVQGGVSTQVTLLERALSLADGDVRDSLTADLTEALIDGYADAGRISEALGLGARFRPHPDPARRASVHLRLARTAAAAGRWQWGMRELSQVRRLIGRTADPALSARVDVVAARLAFGHPSRGRRVAAERLAARALRAAERSGQPDVACGALEMLGRCARLRDLDEADGLYERGLALAVAHGLFSHRITMLYHLGAHDGIRGADPRGLESALVVAQQAGAVVTALNIALETAIVRICRGEYEAALAATARCEETAGRLRLAHTALLALGIRIIATAHRGDAPATAVLLDRFRAAGGAEDDLATAVHGFGLGVLHLLHEEPDLAAAELDRAVADEAARPASYLSFVHGPALLLSVLAGRSGKDACAALAESAQVQAGWNRQFLLLAEAVLHGRCGARAEAEESAARFLELSVRYPLAHHLGLRLVVPAAVEDGWGAPASWLRTAEAFFHVSAPPVAQACRGLLRRVGAPVPQHRQGSDALPPVVRARGITVREFEVLGLVAARLGNAEIGRRLFLSPRTVERHVTALLAKTGHTDRTGLADFAAALGLT
ncbi:BTAD domain-containing putative transcriptional regulator [Catenuloplanes japonicus]|uniref:BTAD domain-containing putative transcriptional regulator n=1 Tax=Catenuloplanes japonicus TaxID=33876 RepID=UPI000691FC2B|nr:BTAD domain-containing putative transcriptional regulator [Catenuloplanes japonicus]